MTGLDGVLLGIDIRPANGQIYGLTTANKIYAIATDGTATFVSTLDTPFESRVGLIPRRLRRRYKALQATSQSQEQILLQANSERSE